MLRNPPDVEVERYDGTRCFRCRRRSPNLLNVHGLAICGGCLGKAYRQAETFACSRGIDPAEPLSWELDRWLVRAAQVHIELRYLERGCYPDRGVIERGRY